MKRKFLLLDEFYLKIIGYITMTFDHVGLFLQMNSKTASIGLIFRMIGRIAFPLFVFMTVEGVLHTKNFGKYILRLIILDLVLIIGELGIYLFDNSFCYASPITDLVMIALTIYLINRKDKFSFFSILPIAYICLSFVTSMMESYNSLPSNFILSIVRTDYSIFGLLLSLGFYISKPLSKLILNDKEETKYLTNTEYEQFLNNFICVFVTILIPIIFYTIEVNSNIVLFNSVQSYAAFAAIPLLFYSGTRGYNAKWFRWASYLYFPLHLVIIFIIFYLGGLL